LAAAVLLIVVACAGCSSQRSATRAQAADYIATGAYLHAREQFVRSSISSLPAGRTPMAAFVAHVQADCGGILHGAPERLVAVGSLPFQKMSAVERRVELAKAFFIIELEQSVETAQRETQIAAADRFAASVVPLRWSDPRITTLVHTSVEIEMQRLHMPPLDVCKKVREWASTGYRKVPAPVPVEPQGGLGRKWVHAVAELGCGEFPLATPLEVSAALRHHQRAGAQPSTRSVELLEARLLLGEMRASLDAKRSLFRVIGLPSARASRPRYSRRHGSSEIAPGELPACTGEPELLSSQVTGGSTLGHAIMRKGGRVPGPIAKPNAYRVPAGSMEPTLPIGTRVTVKKGPLIVGAIAVYYPPEGGLEMKCGPTPHVVKAGGAACDTPVPEEGTGIELIKRIVAGPGDEVFIRGGHVYRKAIGSGGFVRENDPYIRPCASNGDECNFPNPIKIPAGHWFLMGDNRGASTDSRFYGPVPTNWIIGVAAELECRHFTEHGLAWVRRSWREGCNG